MNANARKSRLEAADVTEISTENVAKSLDLVLDGGVFSSVPFAFIRVHLRFPGGFRTIGNHRQALAD